MKLIRPSGTLLALVAILAAVAGYGLREPKSLGIHKADPPRKIRGADSGSPAEHAKQQATTALHRKNASADRQSSALDPAPDRSTASLENPISTSSPKLEIRKRPKRVLQLVPEKQSPAHDAQQETETAGASSSPTIPSPGFPILRKNDREIGPYRLPQPAVWADLGDQLAANPERDRTIQQEAERLADEITGSGLQTDSEEYRALWNTAVADSDQLFRSRFGGGTWMAHHIQAHHLAAAQQQAEP
jgi:hypothetical protein